MKKGFVIIFSLLLTMTAVDASAQEREIIRRPQKQEPQRQSPMPSKASSPTKYAPHTKQKTA